MAATFTRRQALHWAGAAGIATTFLPMPGRYRVWSHPTAKKLQTRLLGRTGREVTTFGLAGGNKVMWDCPRMKASRSLSKQFGRGSPT